MFDSIFFFLFFETIISYCHCINFRFNCFQCWQQLTNSVFPFLFLCVNKDEYVNVCKKRKMVKAKDKKIIVNKRNLDCVLFECMTQMVILLFFAFVIFWRKKKRFAVHSEERTITCFLHGKRKIKILNF